MRFRPGAQQWIGLGIVVTFFNAAGCAPAPDRARYTVDEYRANPTERKRTLRECMKNPGELKDTPDCINAKEAGRIEGIGSLRDLEPLKLPTGR